MANGQRQCGQALDGVRKSPGSVRGAVSETLTRVRETLTHLEDFWPNIPVRNDLVGRGEWCRARREDLGLSQEDVSDGTGVAEGLVSESERGISPNGNALDLIEEFLAEVALTQMLRASIAVHGRLRRCRGAIGA